MPMSNPMYDPDWEAAYTHHEAERDRLDKIIGEKYAASDYSEGLSDLIRQRDEHQSVIFDTFVTRCPTVQDYAKWVFNNFGSHGDAELASHGIPTQIIDYESFRTIDEVRDARERARDTAKQAIAEKTKSLPVSDCITAFAKDRADKILSYWRGFSDGELFQNGNIQKLSVRTLITATEIDGKFHVCFMHDHAHRGMSVINSIECLASKVYGEALSHQENQKQTEASQKGFFRRMYDSVASTKPTIKPDDFVFYVHIPPLEHISEAFIRVDMECRDERFATPDWNHLKEIPATVQSARYDVAKTVEPSKRIALTQEGGPA